MANEQEAITPEILDDVDLSEHENDYSEKGFWDKVQNYAAKAGVTLIYKALQRYYVAQSPACPKKEKAAIGFDSSSPKTSVFDKDLLIQKGYFTNELLTRIQHFIPYTDITDEDKLKIILDSKLSAYQMKKERIKSQFGIDIIGDKEFAEGIINKLKSTDKSVRDINNIVSDAFLNIEYEILDTPGKYKTLRLNRDTATNGNFDLT